MAGSHQHQHSMRVEALVLRHSDWGEADRLLVLYTREQGKLRAIAKGARKLRSRKAGHLEPFTRVALFLAHGRDWWIVTQAETVEAYLPLRDDLLRTASAAYIVELLDRFTYEEGSHQALYDLAVETLQRLSSEPQLFPPLRFFDIRLLDLLGFRPQLFECVGCGSRITAQDQYFSPQQGGVLCPKCGLMNREAWTLKMPTLKYLRHYQRSSYKEVSRVQTPSAVQADMEAFLQSYFVYLLERSLNTPTFLRNVRNDLQE